MISRPYTPVFSFDDHFISVVHSQLCAGLGDFEIEKSDNHCSQSFRPLGSVSDRFVFVKFGAVWLWREHAKSLDLGGSCRKRKRMHGYALLSVMSVHADSII